VDKLYTAFRNSSKPSRKHGNPRAARLYEMKAMIVDESATTG